MRCFLKKYLLCFFLTVFLIAGCVSRQQYNRQTFVLDVKRDTQPAGRTFGILEIPVFSVLSIYAGQGLVTRTSPVGYQTDFYNEFLVAPNQMITDIVRVWFNESGMFSAVITPDRNIRPDYILYGTITQLYGDFSEPAYPKAVVEIQVNCMALHSRQQSVVFSGTYSMDNQIQKTSAQGLVDAYSMCISKILIRLEDDIAQALSAD
ncbi:MAG: ABC-type transport auxiliary lipoprotein family protein [Candidatus Auribacterota bacterium]|jgi:ABC-type uncharacterized transport system auxiliary subunit|nr:ABC-type transport auxiliary lipoprotein family protein [Candidatus Auribacterota bacterium]